REQRSIAPTAISAARTFPVRVNNPYEGNAYAIAEGQRLYEQYNCSGCHFHGGGGIGPALMDNEWIYGSSPANIYTSLAEGRPNGPLVNVFLDLRLVLRCADGLLRRRLDSRPSKCRAGCHSGDRTLAYHRGHRSADH